MTDTQIVTIDTKLIEPGIRKLTDENYELKRRLAESEGAYNALKSASVSTASKQRVSNEEFNQKRDLIVKLRTEDKCTMEQISRITNLPLKLISSYLLSVEGDVKANGVKKAQRADSIRSYDDFKKIQDFFARDEFRHGERERMLWTVGVSTGLRISDLIELKYQNVLRASGSFRTRMTVFENKTKKVNDILITESVKTAISDYIKSIGGKYDSDSYLFASQKGSHITKQYCHSRLKDAQRELDLPINLGSHTMRRSFLNIAACVDKSCVDMNSLTKLQGLANHSSVTTTMGYLNVYKDMFDRARTAVSDFVLGKSGVNELVAGDSESGALASKIDSLIELFGQGVW